ncbi:MAG: hypothetical protein RJB39_263 [Candidatus Parcubacteria bacterium]|jgi:hypothetical protein
MKTYKLFLSITGAVLMFIILVVGVWYGKKQFDIYVLKISEKRELVKFLEKNKQSFDLYKKILVQGSSEQGEIKKYVLSNVTSFSAISKIEVDMIRAGLATKDRGGLMSVSPRENADLNKYNAREVRVELEAEGPYKKVDEYIKTLGSVPYVSSIEKVDLTFLEKIQTTVAAEGPTVRAKIYLIIIETLVKK